VKKLKRDTNYFDKYGNSIFEGDLCQSPIKGGLNDEIEELLYETVSFYKGDWVLMEVDYDYENRPDEPVLLKEYHQKVEVVENTL